MLRLAMPSGRNAERRYVARVVLTDFLGIDFAFTGETADGRWTLTDETGRALHLPDLLLGCPAALWLDTTSLPSLPLAVWNIRSGPLAGALAPRLVDPVLPLLYTQPPDGPGFVSVDDREIWLGFDIFGSIFFMLTRYEEVAAPATDEHGRFRGSASLACREGFLDRPIVDEYVEVLWVLLQRLWPTLKRRRREFRIVPTHDVDEPRRYPHPWRFLRRAAGQVVRGRPAGLPQTWRDWRAVQRGGAWADPWFTFRKIMDISEQAGAQSTFYFLTDRHGTPHNSTQPFDTPANRSLLREIAARGHVIGLHPSYETWRDGAQMQRELAILQRVCEEEGIVQDRWSVRQHYLRLESPSTWRLWDELGFDNDSSLMFADRVGFRCGTCHSFPLFDLEEGRELAVRERPLVVMECSVLDERYMGLADQPEEACRVIAELKDRCRLFDGEFTILWHNNRFEDPREKSIYLSVFDG